MLDIFLSAGLDLKSLKVIECPQNFDEIDIEKALSASARIYYPKVAKKSRLDEMLNRRTQLKIIEEKNLLVNALVPKKEECDVKPDEDQNVDVENDETTEGDLQTIPTTVEASSVPGKDALASVAKEIQSVRQLYSDSVQLAKGYKCYSRSCNVNNISLSQNLPLNCYSPLCVQKARLRKELLLLLKKVQSSTTNNNLNALPSLFTAKDSPRTSILEQHLTSKMDLHSEDVILKDLLSAVACAQEYDEISSQNIAKVSDGKKSDVCFSQQIKKEEDIKDEIDVVSSDDSPPDLKSDTLEESAVPAVGNEMDIEQTITSENEIGPLESLDTDQSETKTENTDTEKRSKRDRKSKDSKYVVTEEEINEGGDRPPIPKLRISTRGRTSKGHTVANTATNSVTTRSANAKQDSDAPHDIQPPKYVYKPTYRALINRRFFCGRTLKKEEPLIKSETASDGTVKIYSSTNSAAKVYLKKVSNLMIDKRKKRTPVKYPLCSTFHTRSKAKSIMVLASHELRKLARHAGKLQVNGFNHNSKPNTSVWPYPCSRPIFKTCWLYRTINLNSLSAVSLQVRILWACVRWDDMAMKPSNNDGKHQITTETEIISLELLKHRHIGQFLEKSQYLRRKVVIPLEVPKTIREVTSIRSGLRKRKRAESPQSMEPQVSEEWVDEDKLELWEIKQYGERAERVLPITRTTTGKLPPARNHEPKENNIVATKATAQEIKEKMEQQLRMQRAAHQQKRALEMTQGIYYNIFSISFTYLNL